MNVQIQPKCFILLGHFLSLSEIIKIRLISLSPLQSTLQFYRSNSIDQSYCSDKFTSRDCLYSVTKMQIKHN